MTSTPKQIAPTAAKRHGILVVGDNVHDTRRVEFLVRLTGCDPYGVADELEAVNWLNVRLENKPVAIVIFHDQRHGNRGLILETTAERLQIPVIDLISLNGHQKRPGMDEPRGDYSINETHLLTTLRRIVSASEDFANSDENNDKEPETVITQGRTEGELSYHLGTAGAWIKPSRWLRLDGQVSKREVEALAPAVLAALKLQENIIIDVHKLESIDLEALSVLCGIHRHVTKQGRVLRLEGIDFSLVEKTIANHRGFAPWTICIKDKVECLWAKIK